MHNYVILYVCCYNLLHVSSNSVLVIRRSNCINTASGIVFFYFRCYTVHVVELLNYYTNYCTYIKLIKFTH